MDHFDDKLHKLKLVINETVEFPTEYYFKLIDTVAEIHQILFILQEMDIVQKASSNGNYISVSGKKMVTHSDEIIIVYKRASVIKGIISL